MKRGHLILILVSLVLLVFFAPLISVEDISNKITGNIIKDNTPYENTERCSDSDGGVFYSVLGTVKYAWGTRWWGRSTTNQIKEDKCVSNNYLVEYYCYKGFPKQISTVCPKGCKDGACIVESNIPKEIIENIDGFKLWEIKRHSDCDDIIADECTAYTVEYYSLTTGKRIEFIIEPHNIDFTNDEFVDGVKKQSPSYEWDIKEWKSHIVLVGEREDYRVVVWYNGRIILGIGVKEEIEEEGEAILEAYLNKYPPDLRGVISETCWDSDGGLDYYKKGELIVGGNIYEDVCSADSSFVKEYFCDNPPSYYDNYYCQNGCVDGACIKSDSGGGGGGSTETIVKVSPVDDLSIANEADKIAISIESNKLGIIKLYEEHFEDYFPYTTSEDKETNKIWVTAKNNNLYVYYWDTTTANETLLAVIPT